MVHHKSSFSFSASLRLKFVFIVVLALLCGCSSRKAATPVVKSSEVAAQLVKVSEIDAVFATSYAAGYRDNASNRAKSEKEISCVMTQITPELMLPVLANALDRKCSQDELQQGIAFYQSDTGKTYVRYEWMKVNVMLGMSTEGPPAYSSSDEDRIVAFEQTCVGKLTTSQDLSLRGAVKEAMTPKLYAIFDQCKNLK